MGGVLKILAELVKVAEGEEALDPPLFEVLPHASKVAHTAEPTYSVQDSRGTGGDGEHRPSR